MVRRAITAGLLFAASALPQPAMAQGSGAASADETPESLPDHPGREEAFYYCIACHSFRIVGRQGMSRERWSGMLDWMTEKHGMPKLDGAERGVILDYLAKAYPPASAPAGGWRNPFAPQ